MRGVLSGVIGGKCLSAKTCSLVAYVVGYLFSVETDPSETAIWAGRRSYMLYDLLYTTFAVEVVVIGFLCNWKSWM